MRYGIAQINPTVGAIAANAELVRRAITEARDRGVDLLILPELTVIGYPPKDLLLKPAVIEECVAAVEDLALECRGITAIIGFPSPSDTGKGMALFNAAAVCRDGQIVQRVVKHLLPTYDVFDERRYFEPGYRISNGGEVVQIGGQRIGISICEDLWTDRDLLPRQLYHAEPIDRLAAEGAEVIVNCSASPFVLRKQELRMALLRNTARRHHLPVIYCNQVGGNDELVFDGNSCAVSARGELIAHAGAFEPDLLTFDLDHAEVELPRIARPEGEMESAFHALVLGVRDYMAKCGFKSAVLGLSGGIDSALTCALAVAAVGSASVRGVSMPSRFSSDHSRDDASELARRLGIAYHVVPIEQPHLAFEALLEPHFRNLPADTTEENVQARIRGVILMAFSNKHRSILLTTGNKSELAVGYCTLYGDMAGGLAVLSDVPKTLVWRLSRWINESPHSPLRQQFGGPVIPDSSISKVPSAELRPNQTDQDSLPPYDLLDQIIERYVEREQSARTIVEETGLDRELVLRVVQLIDRNEYKRKQAAPGIKITGRAFGFGRRMPIAQQYDSRRSLDHPGPTPTGKP